MGESWLMLIYSIAPAVLLVSYILYRDRKNPEPAGKIVKALIFGCLSVPVTLLIHVFWLPIPNALGLGFISQMPAIGGIFKAFWDAAIPEESAKLLMLWLVLRNNKRLDEHLDALVYAVCIGMGFAGIENILYVFQSGDQWQWTAVMRCIYAVPGHYIDAITMGFFYSIVHFHPNKYGKYRSYILLAPIFAHGVYDSICMIFEGNEWWGLISLVPLTWFCFKMHKFCFRRIERLEYMEQDRQDLEQFLQHQS